MATKAASTVTPKQSPPVLSRFLNPERILFIALFVLCLGGIAVSDFSLQYGFWYWLVMVPVLGAAGIYDGWKEASRKGLVTKAFLARQILHWVAMLAVVFLVYVLQKTGRMNQADAGLVLLLALSLAVFLAGVHFNWRFAVLGVVLGASAAMAALVERYFWMMAISVVIGALIVVFWKTAATNK